MRKKFIAKNGVTPVEYLIGYDGITFSNSNDNKQLSFTKEYIFKAVSAVVYENGKMIENPFKSGVI